MTIQNSAAYVLASAASGVFGIGVGIYLLLNRRTVSRRLERRFGNTPVVSVNSMAVIVGAVFILLGGISLVVGFARVIGIIEG